MYAMRQMKTKDHRSDGDCSDISSWLSQFNKGDLVGLPCRRAMRSPIQVPFNVPLLWLFEHHPKIRLPPNLQSQLDITSDNIIIKMKSISLIVAALAVG
jgi:hypothetical protein